MVARTLRAALVRAAHVTILCGIERRPAALEKTRLSDLGDHTAWCGYRAGFIQLPRRRCRPRRCLDITELRVLQRHQPVSVPGWARIQLAGTGDDSYRALVAHRDRNGSGSRRQQLYCVELPRPDRHAV